MENISAIELKTGIEGRGEFWGTDEWFTLWLCGHQVGIIVGRFRAVSQLQGIARTGRIDFAAARAAYLEAVALEAVAAEIAPEPPTRSENAAPVALVVSSGKAPEIKPQREESAKPRCTFHKAIRRCFGIAKERGLDTRDDEAMREAFGRYLCCDVPSRECLTASDWNILGNAIKARRLVQMTREDKRRAVDAMLADDEWNHWSNVKIAHHVGVSDQFVSNRRNIHTSNVRGMERTYTNKHGNVSTMNTAKIGNSHKQLPLVLL